MKYLLKNQETSRLRFRLLQQNDFDCWMTLFGGDIVAKFLGFDTKLSQKERCQLWFDRVFHRYENNLGGMNILVDKNSNQLIGQCGLLVQRIESLERLEIGYSILPQFWNKGYASEAAQKCRDFAFKNHFAGSLISIIHVDNIASEKVALNNNMTFEKRLKNYKGNRVNIFGITQKNWKNIVTTS